MRSAVFYSLAAMFLSACVASSDPKDPPEAPSLGGLEDGSADHGAFRTHLRGTIDFWTKRENRLFALGYDAYIFSARGGQPIRVQAAGREPATDPVLFVFGPKPGPRWAGARLLGANDDFGGHLAARVDFVAPRDGTYLILVRDYAFRALPYTVGLECPGGDGEACAPVCGADDRCPAGSACERRYCIRAPCPSFCRPIDPTVACNEDADCVSIDADCCGCAMGGENRAVHRAYAEWVKPVCEELRACPAVYRCAGEVPQCVQGRCELAPPPPPPPPSEDRCAVVEPGEFGLCEAILGFGFDGEACVPVSGCACDAECRKRVFRTPAECQSICE